MTTSSQEYDLVISNGRVMDPESGLDAVRNIGVSGGTVQALTNDGLQGRTSIDATGLVVSPGFIDLHSHGQDRENYEIQAMDGVTTALELEAGVSDIDGWYAAREGKSPINYGASAGHMPARMNVMRDPGDLTPVGDAAHRVASDAEVTEIKRQVERALEQGALAVGFGLQYTPVASRWEVLELFRVAAAFGASCHVHMRGMGHLEPMNSIEALEELIAASAITGAPLHVVHISSSGLRAAPQLLQMIEEARSRGMDVTTECYPYTAALTAIDSAIFDEGWQRVLGIDFGQLEWTETGERLTQGSFAQYREIGGMVIMHMIPENIVNVAVTSPLTMIATDGWMRESKGHPRTAGSYSRVLGRFVRESKALTLMAALGKMTLMPAQRLESRAPVFRNKGRIRVGADADLTLFDSEGVIDNATFQEPTRPPEGIAHVLVNGMPVVSNGRLQEGVAPGRGLLAPTS
jgi:N-acyl-D-aspartate/D-glutamate deacylase